MNILVFLHSRKHFGAQIVHIPALQSIRDSNPGARIVAIAKFDHALILHKLGYVDEIYIGSGIKFYLNIIRNNFFSRSYSFRPTSFTVDFLTALFGIKDRHAFEKGFFGFFGTKKYSKSSYRARVFYDLTRNSGAIYEECCLSVARNYRSVPDRGKYCLLIPGAGGKDKRWGIDKYLELAQKINAETQYSVLFLFGPEEQEEIEYIKLENNIEYVISPLLDDLFRLIVGSHIVISGDCGPAHIAHVTNTAQIVLFIDVLNEWFEFRHNSLAIAGGSGLQNINVDMVFSLINSIEVRTS